MVIRFSITELLLDTCMRSEFGLIQEFVFHERAACGLDYRRRVFPANGSSYGLGFLTLGLQRVRMRELRVCLASGVMEL